MSEQASISLIKFSEDHIKQTYEWVKSPEFKYLFLLRGEVTYEGNHQYFEKVLSDHSQIVYAIYYKGKHVGNCGFKNISLKKKEAEIWIYIGDSSLRGKGIGLQATRTLLSEAFEKLGLKTIYLHVADYNAAAINMYKKLGFSDVSTKASEGEWSDRGCKIVRMELKK